MPPRARVLFALGASLAALAAAVPAALATGPEGAFSFEVEQKLQGSANYTKRKLAAALGQNIDYRITVKNTGPAQLNLGPLTDSQCEDLVPAGAIALAVGGTQTYTCEHRDLAVGDYSESATIVVGGQTRESNRVQAEVPANAAFTVRAEQELAGGAAYTAGNLVAKLGQSVAYRITVKNTGDLDLTVSPLSVPECEHIVPSGSVKLAVGGSETYSCARKALTVGRYSEVAAVMADGQSEESNRLEVEVPASPGFTIEAEQKLEGAPAYTTHPLVVRQGADVAYRITVKNTGDVQLTLGPLSDAHCDAIAPSGSVELAPGATQVYTCAHKNLALGMLTNVAKITAGGQSRESNELEVQALASVTLSIEAEQKLAGASSYTKAKLTATLGQTVEYRITVRNPGGSEERLSPLSDPMCEHIVPAGPVAIGPGASVTYTCEHEHLALGTYTDVARIAANAQSRESNELVAEVPAHLDFVVEAEQELTGGSSYTKAKLTARLGQGVSYRIKVKNLGNLELTLAALSDSGCEDVLPRGSVKLAVGASLTYTCVHRALAVGAYANVAKVTANGQTRESNRLEAEVPARPSFTLELQQKLAGGLSYTESKLEAQPGETVDYRITAKNTGNVELELGALSDQECQTIAPSGPVKLAIGRSQIYTCERRSLAAGLYTNVAKLSDNHGQTVASNTVQAEG